MLGECESGSVSMSALSDNAAYWSGSPASLIKRECIRYEMEERSAWSRSIAARRWRKVRVGTWLKVSLESRSSMRDIGRGRGSWSIVARSWGIARVGVEVEGIP